MCYENRTHISWAVNKADSAAFQPRFKLTFFQQSLEIKEHYFQTTPQTLHCVHKDVWQIPNESQLSELKIVTPEHLLIFELEWLSESKQDTCIESKSIYKEN